MPSNCGVEGDGFAASLAVQDELDLIDTEIGLGFQGERLGGEMLWTRPSPRPFSHSTVHFREPSGPIRACDRFSIILPDMLSGDTCVCTTVI